MVDLPIFAFLTANGCTVTNGLQEGFVLLMNFVVLPYQEQEIPIKQAFLKHGRLRQNQIPRSAFFLFFIPFLCEGGVVTELWLVTS